MVIRIVLLVAGIVGLLFAALFLLAPDIGMAGFHLGQSDLGSRLFARNFGLALLALAVIDILASADSGSTTLWAVLLGNLLVHLGAPAVDLTETLTRDAGWWTSMAIHLGFVIAFGYCLVNYQRLVSPEPPRAGTFRRGRA